MSEWPAARRRGRSANRQDHVRRERDQFGRVSTSTLGIGPRSFGSRSERRAHQPFCGTRTSGARAGHPATDKNADNQCYREKNSFTR